MKYWESLQIGWSTCASRLRSKDKPPNFGTRYKQGIILAGILLLQNIDQRLDLDPLHRQYGVLRRLIGEQNMKNVVLITTMWEQVGERSDVGDPVEQALRKDTLLWKPMIKDCPVAKYLNTPESALKVIGMITGKGHPLLVQEEMVTQGKGLHETTVGLYIDGLKAEAEDDDDDDGVKAEQGMQSDKAGKSGEGRRPFWKRVIGTFRQCFACL